MDEDSVDVFFDSLLTIINNARSAASCPDVADFRSMEFSCSDAMFKEVVTISEDMHHVSSEEKAKKFALKHLATVINDSESDVQTFLLSRLATHIDVAFSFEDTTINLSISIYFLYLELEHISPVIDGALVVQGSILNPDYGPIMCTVEFAADHEEDFTHVMNIPPWEIMTVESDESVQEGDDQPPLKFMVAIRFPNAADYNDGVARISVYVDRVANIPAVETDDEPFDYSPAGYIGALQWTTRATSGLDEGGDEEGRRGTMSEVPGNEGGGGGGGGRGSGEGGRGVLKEGDSFDGSFPSDEDNKMELDVSRSNADDMITNENVIQSIRIAVDYEDLMQAKAEGYQINCALISTETGLVEEEQESLWRFHICYLTGPAEDGGVEDIVFLKTGKSMGTLPVLKDYDVYHDVDLTEIDDDFSCYLAVKSGRRPRFTKMVQLSVDSNSLIGNNRLQEYTTTNNCMFRKATDDICNHLGGVAGLALQQWRIGGQDSTSPSAVDRSNEQSPFRSGDKAGKSRDSSLVKGKSASALHGSNSSSNLTGRHGSHSHTHSHTHSREASMDDGDAEGEAREYNSEEDEDEDEEDEEAIEDMLAAKLDALRMERQEEMALNGELQKKCVALLQKEKSLQVQNTQPGPKPPTAANAQALNQLSAAALALEAADTTSEKYKQYTDLLGKITEHRRKYRLQEEEFDLLAHDLQMRLDDKEFKSADISASFKEFKREILGRAVNSRTGKVISKRLVAQYELVDQKREEVLEQVRLKNISMRNLLHKLERQLRAKEHLAENLHMIDFEQLKIENQTLSEKIEERGEELIKLRRKKSTNVQMLSHVREKLRFIEKKNKAQGDELVELNKQLVEVRSDLTIVKRDRDTIRGENKELQQRQGFANSDLLIKDYEKMKVVIDSLNGEIRDLQQKYKILAKSMDMTVDAVSGLVVSPMRRSQTVSSLSLDTSTGTGTSNASRFASPQASMLRGPGAGTGTGTGTLEVMSPIRSPYITKAKAKASALAAEAGVSGTMTPMRHSSSTGSMFVKLPPLSADKRMK